MFLSDIKLKERGLTMKGYLSRRFFSTIATVGYFDLQKNDTVKCKPITGRWKTPEEVVRYVKKNRELVGIPQGKTITVLSMEQKTELRRMKYETFYEHSEPVPQAETSFKKTVKTKKGKR